MGNVIASYGTDQRNGLIRTFLFAVAWGVALFASMAADSVTVYSPTNQTDPHLDNYDISAYASNLSSLAWLMLGGFGLDILLHVVNQVGVANAYLDMLRELAIIGTGCLALIAFVAGMVKLNGEHASKPDDGKMYWTAVATYSYLASSILASARLRNIDLNKQQSYVRDEAILPGRSSVGSRYNKVPQVEAHNFY